MQNWEIRKPNPLNDQLRRKTETPIFLANIPSSTRKERQISPLLEEMDRWTIKINGPRYNGLRSKTTPPPSFPVSGTGEKWEGGGSSIGDPHSGRRWCGRGCREIRRWFACVVTGLCQPSKIHDVHCWKFDTHWDTHSQHTCVCIYMIYVYVYVHRDTTRWWYRY